MSDSDIQEFVQAYSDFMQHAQTEIQSHQQWEEARHYTEMFYEQKAAELEVTVDYYMMEFT